MIADAEAEGHQAALLSFKFANEVEKTHAILYQKALDTLDNPQAVDYYVSSGCGHTVGNEPPDVCPVCGAKAEAFKKIDLSGRRPKISQATFVSCR